MDPITIVGLGAKVVDVLMPYVKKGEEQFKRDVGIAACEKVESLARTLKERLSGDKTTIDMLNEFEKNPEDYRPVLEKILQKKVEQDTDLATELTKHLKGMGPNLKVIQKMKDGEEVIGIEAEEMTEGTAEVVQEIDKGKKIVGQKFGRIGK
jgi:hypothetical protein